MPSFFYYVLNLSTVLVHSITLPMHQPFEAVMEVSGVKIRSLEQTMLPVEETSCWLQIASQRTIQRQMTSDFPPPDVHALTWQGYVTHIMRMVSCIAMSFA